MSKTEDGQVQLSKLIFTHNWEDPAVDEKALQISPGDTVFSITSGGCNTLGFLRFHPANIYCLDINPAQTYLMELKLAAFKHLSRQELWAFFGLTPCTARMILYERIRGSLSDAARKFFDERPAFIRKGLIMNGRYERFVKIAGWAMRMLQGSRKVSKLFAARTLEEQRQFYAREWNNRRWRWIFSVMFNKDRLAKRGLNADYFHFDDGSSSFSESFQQRAAHALTNIPVQSNYFLSLYLQGKYSSAENVPAYLDPRHFATIKANCEHIHPVTADGKYWLEARPDNFFDAMALSNICELMDDEDTHKLFTEVARTARPGARIVFRNLIVPREVPEDLRSIIVKDERLSRELQDTDRSFVYGKVAAYKVFK